MRFTVFSHVEHTQRNGDFFGYGPYIREMKLWFKLFPQVEVIAPCSARLLKETDLAYQKTDLTFTAIPSIGLSSPRQLLLTIIRLPVIIYRMTKAMYRSDHLHLRCPGNIGLLACILQVFFPWKNKTAKYAGNWDPSARQFWSYRFQKWVLSNTFLTRNLKVLVYGEWPGQTTNIIPFFTASFTAKDALKVKPKDFSPPYLFLFVGRLSMGKRPDISLGIIKELKSQGIPAVLEVYGDGPEESFLRMLSRQEGLDESVKFMGNRKLAKIKEAYQRADFLILASDSEGWPKAVSEAMFFGCIPIATAVSCVPRMLGYQNPQNQGRGVLLKKNNFPSKYSSKPNTWTKEQVTCCAEAAKLVVELLKDREAMIQMSTAARQWSQHYTLERFEDGIREILELQEKGSVGITGSAISFSMIIHANLKEEE